MDPRKENAINAMWQAVFAAAGIEREKGEVGPPTHVPEGLGFTWYPMADSNKPTVIQPNMPCPFNTKIEVFTIFHDTTSRESRVYGMAMGEGYFRWTVSRDAPTRYLQKLTDDVFIRALAADLLLAEAEFDALEEEKIECTACGTENDEDATFCKECGAEMQPPKVEPNGASDDNLSPAV